MATQEIKQDQEQKENKVEHVEEVQVEEKEKEEKEDKPVPHRIGKARYWVGVLWTENMIEDWQEKIEDLLQLPFCYCIHNKCVDEKGKPRPAHVHMIIAFPNTTTYNHARNVFRLLGEKACNTCQTVQGMRNQYEYLIHNTKTAIKQGKHQYDPSERICGNNFDIGLYEQLSAEEVHKIYEELLQFVLDGGFWTITEFTRAAYAQFKDLNYRDVMRRYNATWERYCAGNFKDWDNHRKRLRLVNNEDMQAKDHEAHAKAHAVCCPECGSVDCIKRGKTAGGAQRYACKDCGKKWS